MCTDDLKSAAQRRLRQVLRVDVPSDDGPLRGVSMEACAIEAHETFADDAQEDLQ